MPDGASNSGKKRQISEVRFSGALAAIDRDLEPALGQPVSLRQGKLIVSVAHSAWVQELRPLKPRMLQAIQQRVGKAAVRDIIFRNG